MRNLFKFLLKVITIGLMVFIFGGCEGALDGPKENTTIITNDDSGEGGTAIDVEADTDLVINEIVAKDPSDPDWIELYASGDVSVSLSDYSLIDDSEDAEKASLPDVTLAPGEFFVVLATDEAPDDGSAYVPFKLGADDAVYLYKGESAVSVLDWDDGDAPEGYSYGRLPDGYGDAITLAPTPGAANQEGSETPDDDPEDDEEEIVRPDGWEEETHGDEADANYDVVFKEAEVHRLDITVDPEDWQAMLDNMTEMFGEFGSGGGFMPFGAENGEQGETPSWEDRADFDPGDFPPDDMFPDENPIWMPCTVNFQGKQWLHVGIRFKGQSSLMSTWFSGIYKLPFRLDFDEFEDDYPEIENQRFYGFQKLSLVSNFSDNSFLREKLTADIFRDAGVPAARTAFYRLFIDHGEGSTYFGLYTLVEIPHKPMLESQFSGSGGNLYKPKGAGAKFSVYDESSFDKETNKDEADFSDVKALYDALHADRADAQAWREGLEATFNVPGFIRWLAVNTVIQNWDTYGLMAQNYYLYNDPETGLLNWIPWDNNMALTDNGMMMGDALSLELTEVDDEWPLIRYLMDDPVYYDMYVDEVNAVATNVFYPERMEPIYTAAKWLIRRYVIGAEGEIDGYTFLRSNFAFNRAVRVLLTHVQSRYDEAMAFMEAN